MGRAERATCPPFLFPEVSIAAGHNAYLAALRRCPPNSTSFVGGRPRDDFGTQVRFCVPSCNSLLNPKAPHRKTPTSSRSARGTPKLWGSQTRRIPLPWHNARKKRSATRRQARFAGGMLCVLRDLHRSSPMQNSLHASIAPQRETPTSNRSASLPPISSVAPKWGAANAPSHPRYGTVARRKHSGSRRQARFAGGAGAVCGGACHAFCTTCNEAPQAQLTAKS